MLALNVDYSDLDYDNLALSIGIKNRYIPMIMESFLKETDSILEALEESIESKDYDKIRLNAHAIKGSAGNIKFNEIYEMAMEIESEAAKKNNEFDYKLYFDAIKNAVGTISL
ncbi:MAG: Hpt domain-containing protein [Sulfurimonas sp.]|uniref:Hpt domain-containing protein n=1 Tax=Sulfurimonas sp. TaxID=2022749 RepID=UPI0028CE39EE|nr:Hpt domain-containing protein [Sulfurimonas sp.]MDT8338165.1 Hpt domain-containing protein [Sulfurimonas sp.]